MSLSHVVSGACSSPPRVDAAMTASALGMPRATRFVPWTGSTAMSTSGPRPDPTRSPMNRHWGFIAFAFANQADRTVDVDPLQTFPHRLDHSLIGAICYSPATISRTAPSAPSSVTCSSSIASKRSTTLYSSIFLNC